MGNSDNGVSVSLGVNESTGNLPPPLLRRGAQPQPAQMAGAPSDLPLTLDPEPWTLDPEPWTLDPGPGTLDPGPWTLDPGPWTLDPGP